MPPDDGQVQVGAFEVDVAIGELKVNFDLRVSGREPTQPAREPTGREVGSETHPERMGAATCLDLLDRFFDPIKTIADHRQQGIAGLGQPQLPGQAQEQSNPQLPFQPRTW